MPSYLIRKLANADAWRRAYDGIEAGNSALPIEVLREFTPRERDKYGVSVYLIQDLNSCDLAEVAAALVINSNNIEAARTTFATAMFDDVKSAGFDVQVSPSELGFSRIDVLHHNIVVRDANQLTTLALMFSKEPLREVRAPIVKPAIDALLSACKNFSEFVSVRNARSDFSDALLRLAIAGRLVPSPIA